jgi:hypothetical protein
LVNDLVGQGFESVCAAALDILGLESPRKTDGLQNITQYVHAANPELEELHHRLLAQNAWLSGDPDIPVNDVLGGEPPVSEDPAREDSELDAACSAGLIGFRGDPEAIRSLLNCVLWASFGRALEIATSTLSFILGQQVTNLRPRGEERRMWVARWNEVKVHGFQDLISHPPSGLPPLSKFLAESERSLQQGIQKLRNDHPAGY